MKLHKATYISEKYTYEDYLELGFNLNSPENVWEKAIDIFIDRIKSRYFYAIDKLMENKSGYEMLKYGFAIVTLQCSLIDTLAKFRYGAKKQGNKEKFENFLKEYFIFGYNAEILARKFYKDIRCGLVHSGSIDNMSGLSCHLFELVTVLENGAISLDLIIMQNKLNEYFKSYIKKLKSNEKELRKNFVYTMDKVCKAN